MLQEKAWQIAEEMSNLPGVQSVKWTASEVSQSAYGQIQTNFG